MVQSTNSKMFMTSPMTPTTTDIPTWSSYDSHSPSFDHGHNLNGYAQMPALIRQQRVTEPFSDPPGAQTRPGIDTRQLSWWRAGVQKALMKSLVHESRLLGTMQAKLRAPLLDKYFLYTSSLGTHMFFMTVLPCLFFFGHTDTARGLVHTMCATVYITSFFKDLFCSPRPFAPPVTRLTIGNHHLEYGFPSTHSANTVSFAVYLYALLRNAAADPTSSFSSPTVYNNSLAILLWYGTTIVFGRLYCGMHSFTDVTVGTVIGALVGALQGIYGERIEHFIANANWLLPVCMALASLLLVNQHPQPVDDCPCFEDAIACLAVLLGVTISRWHAAQIGLDIPSGFFKARTPGWEYSTTEDVILWWSFAFLKIVIGVAVIFMWRILVKQILHAVLPPTFRLISGIVGFLPTRRFYTPATEYEKVPVEKGLRPIPSMMDLPGALANAGAGLDGAEASATGTLPHAHLYNAEKGLKWRRSGGGTGALAMTGTKHDGFHHEKHVDLGDESEDVEEADVKHYDADVLTKFAVYGGIGALASHLIPVAFELLGWGVLPVS